MQQLRYIFTANLVQVECLCDLEFGEGLPLRVGVWWWLMLKHLVKSMENPCGLGPRFVWISLTWAMLANLRNLRSWFSESWGVFSKSRSIIEFGIFHLADLPFFPLAPLTGDLSFRTRSISSMRCTRPCVPDRLWTGLMVTSENHGGSRKV